MPKLIMVDGTITEIPYTKGAEILAMLDGQKTPTAEQALFLTNVKTVLFEPVRLPGQPVSRRAESERKTLLSERRQRIEEINNDYTIKGVAKTKAIRDVIKSTLLGE